MMHKGPENNKSKTNFLFILSLNCMIGIIICLLLSFVFSLLIANEKLPISSINFLSYTSTFIGVCIASILSSLKFGKNILTALFQAALCLAVFYLLGAIFFSRLLPTRNVLATLLSSVSGSVFGAIIVALFKSRKR